MPHCIHHTVVYLPDHSTLMQEEHRAIRLAIELLLSRQVESFAADVLSDEQLDGALTNLDEALKKEQRETADLQTGDGRSVEVCFTVCFLFQCYSLCCVPHYVLHCVLHCVLPLCCVLHYMLPVLVLLSHSAATR